MPKPQSFNVNGHTVEYRRVGELEEVRIDGELHSFFRSGKGYSMERDAYVPPQDSLLEAAMAYARRLPARRKE